MIDNADNFEWEELLLFYEDIVSTLDVGVLKFATSNPLTWHKGETQYRDLLPIDIRQQNTLAVFSQASRCRAIMSKDQLDQHAFQISVEASDGCQFAVGIFPEEVFHKWAKGKWRLPVRTPGLKWEKIGTEVPTSGTQITNEGLTEALKLTNTFTTDEFDLFGASNFTYDSYILVENTYFKPVRPISPITEVDGGVVIAIRTSAAASSALQNVSSISQNVASASRNVLQKIAKYLDSNKVKVEDWFQHSDFNKDDKLSLLDLHHTAKLFVLRSRTR